MTNTTPKGRGKFISKENNDVNKCPGMYWAAKYMRDLGVPEMMIVHKTIEACAESGNFIAKIYQATFEKINKGEPISNEEFMSLAWGVYGIREDEQPAEVR